MTEVRDLLTPPILSQQAHFAIVAENAVDYTDTIRVTLPDFDPTQLWGPCRWQARDAFGLPQKGDEALVVFDNQMNPWIVSWWPF